MPVNLASCGAYTRAQLDEPALPLSTCCLHAATGIVRTMQEILGRIRPEDAPLRVTGHAASHWDKKQNRTDEARSAS